jgi:hypothetical protein
LKNTKPVGGTAFPGCAHLIRFLATGWKACATNVKKFLVLRRVRPTHQVIAVFLMNDVQWPPCLMAAAGTETRPTCKIKTVGRPSLAARQIPPLGGLPPFTEAAMTLKPVAF